MMDAWHVMKWPLLASLVLPWILVYYGLHVVQRQIIFVDLALAQVAALGYCLAILLGHDAHDWQSYAWALSFTVVGAAVFTLTRTRDRRVPQEALIGMVYIIAAAGALLLLSHSVGGNEELRRTLVGEILVVSPGEILLTLALYLVIGGVHFVFRRQFLMITFDPIRAAAEGLSIARWDFLFYILFGVVVTTFVHLGGVLLVFAYLVGPAVCGALLTDRPGRRMLIGWGSAIIASILGLYASYRFDLPTGAAIVCALGLVVILVAPIRRFVR